MGTDLVPCPSMSRAKHAARLSYFVTGFSFASWAPMVPYAKARLAAGNGEFGLLLLFLAFGSLLGMPAAGRFASRFGAGAVITCACVGSAIALPLLATVNVPFILAGSLFLLGLALGASDIAMAVHGSAVQLRAKTQILAGFHALFGAGCLTGALAMTTLLAAGFTPAQSALFASTLILVCGFTAAPRYLPIIAAPHPFLVRPKGIVIILCAMAMLIFLLEGAVADWSALLLTETRRLPAGCAGVAYVMFALCMSLSRFAGDRLITLLGRRAILLYGPIIAGLGLLAAAWSASPLPCILGFALAGLGAANIIPVIFTIAGSQNAMPPSAAIAVTSTVGYLGMLAGPAAIGQAASFVGLPAAFTALALILTIISLLSRAVRL